MEYRKLTKADLPEAAAFAIEGMRAEMYPALRVAPAKVLALVTHFERSGHDFHLGAWHDGRLVGAIAALSSEMLLHDWCEAHVVMCRAVVPGVGRRLIGALRDWAMADPRIRRVQFPQEFHADPRALRLLARYGFQQRVTTCVLYKG